MLNFKKFDSDSPTHYGNSPTRRVFFLTFKSRLSDSASHGVVDSLTCRVGESFFDYEYLRKFEAKSGTAQKVVLGIYEEPISAKTPENPPYCHVPLK